MWRRALAEDGNRGSNGFNGSGSAGAWGAKHTAVTVFQPQGRRYEARQRPYRFAAAVRFSAAHVRLSIISGIDGRRAGTSRWWANGSPTSGRIVDDGGVGSAAQGIYSAVLSSRAGRVVSSRGPSAAGERANQRAGGLVLEREGCRMLWCGASQVCINQGRDTKIAAGALPLHDALARDQRGRMALPCRHGATVRYYCCHPSSPGIATYDAACLPARLV